MKYIVLIVLILCGVFLLVGGNYNNGREGKRIRDSGKWLRASRRSFKSGK